MPGLRRLIRPPRLFGRLAIAVVLVMGGIAYGHASRRDETGARRLAAALLAERFTTGRLTGQSAWHPCAPVDTAALVPRVRCGEPLDPRSRRARRINALARLGSRAAGQDSSAAGMRGAALVELRFADTLTRPLERAVAALEQAHRLDPADAGTLNELAVARLALAERTQRLTPMLRALDAIERAVERDSLRAEILFNRALILQRLYLVASAQRAWERYLVVERDPDWRAEAQAHARWVAQVPDTVSWDALRTAPPATLDSATRAGIAARVRRSPQKAREFGFPLLAAWGAAVQGGDSARAARLLAVAREIGAAARGLGLDESVGLAVDAIDAADGDSGRIHRLATGHIDLAEGRSAYVRNAYDSATQAFTRSERSLREAGSPTARWAAFYRGAASVNSVEYARGDSVFSRLATAAGPEEDALIGRSLWALGLSQVRRGNYDRAVRLYRQAAPHIARTGDPELQGGLAVLLAEGLALSGEATSARLEAYQALRLLSSFRRSNILGNHLANVAAYAREDRLPHGALAVTTEMVHVARVLDKPEVLALSLCARVRDLVALDRPGDAQAALDEAMRWSARIGPGRSGDRIRAQVALAIGQLTRSRDPRAALPLLADAVETYSGFERDLYLPAALYEAAMAARASGDLPRAQRWLQRAMDFIDVQRGSFQLPEARATFSETVENVFDEMIDLDLEELGGASAFRVLERARAHAVRAEDDRFSAAAPGGLSTVAASLPDDMLFVEYAVLQNRLVIWTVTRRGTRRYTVEVPRDSLAALAESAPDSPAASARLFELLLRPLRDQLTAGRRLTVVPDRELYNVPFAALRDAGTGRYVVQDHQVRTVPSAAFFLAAGRKESTGPAGAGVLVVGDPRLDPAAAGPLSPLPGAAREAESVAALHPGSTLLKGAQARRGNVLQMLPEHSVFHFAGHAVFNSEQPELSYLALASDGPDDTGILRAREIAELRLSNVKVVVLSACSSLSPRATHTGAVAGLAYSFLRAGAPATVSTLWDVDDGATTDLLVEFHRHLAAGTSAAEALRLAQVQALRSPRPELREPRAWAAFIYTGP